MIPQITDANLAALWPHADPAFRQILLEPQAEAYALGGIATKLALAHFWAQCSHECGGGTEMIENLNYSSDRLMEVWPGRFPSLESTVSFAHNPKALGNKVYNGRMGNRVGTDDGFNYRGRGLLQETGHEEYKAVGDLCGLDLLAHPERAADPKHALTVACASWKLAGCEAAAEADNLPLVTRKINGGLVGLQARRVWLGRWRAELGA